MSNKKNDTVNFTLRCTHCGRENVFDQPYPYHAGFADQGFLYNDEGNLTLVWSMLDPILERLFPGDILWTNHWRNRRIFERLLKPAPTGGRWRFRNPARCSNCHKTISKPMLQTSHYLLYPGSVLSDGEQRMNLIAFLKEG